MKKTYSPKAAQVKRVWHKIDAAGMVVGRLAVQIAQILMGKGKTTFARHIDSGDQVVVTNVEKTKFSGKKETTKNYHTHSGYAGGHKLLSVKQVRETKPDRIVEHAVSGMLPKNKLRPNMLKRLHLIKGDQNPYEQHFSK